MPRPTICLNMIVKNEAHVIARCLDSARPLIDRWCIVDTGSSDGTQARIRELMQGIPGTLHERPWKNFGHNRTEALELAGAEGCDYLLFIDADEHFEVPEGFAWPALQGEAYELTCHYAGISYARGALVASRLPWRWQGVLHEYLASTAPHAWQPLAAPAIVVQHDGARARDPNTYLKDMAVLQEALVAEPGNTRYVFYLAQSQRDAGLLAEARENYLRRAAMGGWDEEVWYALFQAAVMAERLQMPAAEVQAAYLAAYEARPTRAEPLVELARFQRLRGLHAHAAVFAQAASALASPPDRLFVDGAAYRWRALDELAVSAYYVPGEHWQRTGQHACAMLVEKQNALPAEVRERVLQNARFYAQRNPGLG